MFSRSGQNLQIYQNFIPFLILQTIFIDLIKDLQKIAPLNDLLKKGVEFEWKQDHNDVFQN